MSLQNQHSAITLTCIVITYDTTHMITQLFTTRATFKSVSLTSMLFPSYTLPYVHSPIHCHLSLKLRTVCYIIMMHNVTFCIRPEMMSQSTIVNFTNGVGQTQVISNLQKNITTFLHKIASIGCVTVSKVWMLFDLKYTAHDK